MPDIEIDFKMRKWKTGRRGLKMDLKMKPVMFPYRLSTSAEALVGIASY